MNLRQIADRADWLLPASVACSASLFTLPHVVVPDDAFITFRYAENLASGCGFVYNPGERVLGTTSPLFGLILALFRLLGLPPLVSSRVVGIVSAVLLSILAWFYVKRVTQQRWAGLAAGVVMAVSPQILRSSVSSMETVLFVTLTLGALVADENAQATLAAILCGFAVLTRPEGLLLVGLIAIKEWLQGWRNARCFATSFLLVALPWLVFAQCFYGSPIPNSVTMKMVFARSAGTRATFREVLNLLLFGPGQVPLIALLALFGSVWTFRNRRSLILALWIISFGAFYLTARPQMFDWYAVPFSVGLLLLAVLGLAWILESTAPQGLFGVWLSTSWVRGTVGGTLAVAMAVGIMVADVRLWQQPSTEDARVELGLWIRDHTPLKATLLVDEVGHLGYYSERRTWDLAMLVVPAEVSDRPAIRKPNYPPPWLTLIEDLRPDYCVMAGEQNVVPTGNGPRERDAPRYRAVPLPINNSYRLYARVSSNW